MPRYPRARKTVPVIGALAALGVALASPARAQTASESATQAATAPLVTAAAIARAAQQSQPGSSATQSSAVPIHGFFVGSFSYNQRLQMVPEFAGGAQALADAGRSNFRFDKFGLSAMRAFTPWLSAGATVEIESHKDVHAHGFAPGFGCVGGATCIERFGAEEPTVEADLDRFQVTLVAPVGNGLSFSVGRFDTPFGIEKHDPPLNFTATTSELFQFGRPMKMTGLQTSYVFSPYVDVSGWVVNRWESETTHTPFDDNNASKSIGGRLGFTPIPTAKLTTLGVGTFYGKETDEGEDARWIVDLDFTTSPSDRLVFAAEALWGGENGVSFRPRGVPYAGPPLVNGATRWWSFYMLPHYDFNEWSGITVRYGAFKDRDGARTGVEQTLQSLTVVPVFHLSGAAPNAGSTGAAYARTRHPIHWLDLKMEYRFLHSDRNVFADAPAAVDIPEAASSGHQLQLQFVLNF